MSEDKVAGKIEPPTHRCNQCGGQAHIRYRDWFPNCSCGGQYEPVRIVTVTAALAVYVTPEALWMKRWRYRYAMWRMSRATRRLSAAVRKVTTSVRAANLRFLILGAQLNGEIKAVQTDDGRTVYRGRGGPPLFDPESEGEGDE